MPKNEKKKRSWRDKYRFSVSNDTTFQEVWRIRLTKYNSFLLITFLLFFIIGSTASAYCIHKSQGINSRAIPMF